LGGAVVIIGALFKILHLEIGPITGGLVLGLGLGTEALIFTVSALNTGEIKEEHDDFVKKVKGGGGKAASAEEPGLSSKIDEMLREAKLDVTLINNLTRSIKNLEASAQALSPAADAASSSEAYSQQLATASQKLEQLNQVYAEQVNSAGNNAAFNEKVAENADKLKQQMEALSSNLAALNQVYNGMLSAMNKN
jgi:gliding motility-associated protein GldL